MADDLRARIALALDGHEFVDGLYECTCGGRVYNIDEHRARIAASVVQPELDRRDAVEAKARADIAAAEADLARCRKRLEDTRRIVAEWEDATAERDRYRLAWQSARRRAAVQRKLAVRARELAEMRKGRLHKYLDLTDADWYRQRDEILRLTDELVEAKQCGEQAEAAIARVTALEADMRTWASPHGLADHYANQLRRATAGPEATPKES